MAGKKKYKGEVTKEFKYKDKTYRVGDVFSTIHEHTFQHLLTRKNIK